MAEKLALLGGNPVFTRSFPHWPQGDIIEIELLKEVVQSGYWSSVLGTQVKKFERDFAAFHGASYGIAVTNGTQALELALRTVGVGPGDEVIIPSITFIATAMAVFNVGGCPVAVDVQADTWCIDPEVALEAISPKTRAIIPVHLAGYIAEMDSLKGIFEPLKIHIIEDAAHAHGARWKGRGAGSFGTIGAFSFQNYKLMTSGEGGILLTNSQDVYERASLIANCGFMPQVETEYDHSLLGSNYRMSEFQGAVLNAQLLKFEQLAGQRERAARQLNELVEKVEGLQPQIRDLNQERHANYMYVFTYDSNQFEGLSRKDFVRALWAEGVPAFRMYPQVQHTPFYESAVRQVSGNIRQCFKPCPISREIADKGVWLHHQALLGDEEMTLKIVEAIEKVRREAKQLIIN